MPVDFSDEQEGLEAWLSTMWMELEVEYPEELPEDFHYEFDRQSLAELEEFLLSEFAGIDELRTEENKHFLDRTARYIGETLRKNFRGEWQAGTGMFDGLPVIAFPDEKSFPVSPFSVVNIVLVRRTGGELVHIFDGLTRLVGPPAEAAGGQG